jgi:hypothetical protein
VNKPTIAFSAAAARAAKPLRFFAITDSPQFQTATIS